jgi:ABC-type glycerol-3-phosphate transport system permease component
MSAKMSAGAGVNVDQQVTGSAASRRRSEAARVGERVGLSFTYLLVFGLSLAFMLPFFWTISSSLKHPSELYVFPPTWLPETPQWSNYQRVWQEAPFGRWLWNSTLVTVLSVIGTIISASLVGFSFARFRYPFRDAIFLATLSTMMLPVEVTLIPTYLLFNKLGWLDTYLPLIVPNWFGGGAFFIFLMRQFFMSLPRELDDAGRIDGANSLDIFWRILMPLCKPALATMAVISFVNNWDEFLGPFIYLLTPIKFTVAVGLRKFQTDAGGETEPMEHLLMAASLIVAAPMILLFFVAQRYFVRGIVMSGIKG